MNAKIKMFYNTPVLLELIEYEKTNPGPSKYVYKTMMDFLTNNYYVIDLRDLSEISTQEEMLSLLDKHNNCIYRRKTDIYPLCIALSNMKEVTCRHCKLKNLENNSDYKFVKIK